MNARHGISATGRRALRFDFALVEKVTESSTGFCAKAAKGEPPPVISFMANSAGETRIGVSACFCFSLCEKNPPTHMQGACNPTVVPQ